MALAREARWLAPEPPVSRQASGFTRSLPVVVEVAVLLRQLGRSMAAQAAVVVALLLGVSLSPVLAITVALLSATLVAGVVALALPVLPRRELSVALVVLVLQQLLPDHRLLAPVVEALLVALAVAQAVQEVEGLAD